MSGSGESSEVWLDLVKALAMKSEAVSKLDELRLVQAFDELLRSAPCDIVSLLGTLPSRKLVLGMIGAGAAESAALALIETGFGYMLSRSPNGISIASVWLPVLTDAVDARADRPAAALTMASCKAIVAAKGYELGEARPN